MLGSFRPGSDRIRSPETAGIRLPSRGAEARGGIRLDTKREEIERLAGLALAPLVEIAWADGRVTDAERRAVLEAARLFGLRQSTEFCRSTLLRWLHEEPPSEALDAWRQLLAPTLGEADSRSARQSERALLDEAHRVAKMDERSFVEGESFDARSGISDEEKRVLDELREVLQKVDHAREDDPPEDDG